MLEQRGLTMWPWLVVPRWSRDLPCPTCHLSSQMLSHHKIISTFVTQFNLQPQPPETKTSWYNLSLVTEIHSCRTKHGGTSFCFGGWYQISTADQIPDRDGKYMSIWRQIHYKECWWRIEDDILLIKQWAILNVFWMVWAEPRAAWTLDSCNGRWTPGDRQLWLTGKLKFTFSPSTFCQKIKICIQWRRLADLWSRNIILMAECDSLDNILPWHLSWPGLGEDPNDFHIPRGYPHPLLPSLRTRTAVTGHRMGSLSQLLGLPGPRPGFQGPQLLSVEKRLWRG